MTNVSLSAFGGVGWQFTDDNGDPLSGGKIYSYQAGTTTPLTTYTSATGTVPHANPIILDAAGRVPGGEIWLQAIYKYKFVLQTSTSVLLGTFDNIGGVFAAAPFVDNFTGTGSATSFTLSTTPSNVNNTNVFINGVYQNKNTYTVTVATLTFSQAPPVNSRIEIVYV